MKTGYLNKITIALFLVIALSSFLRLYGLTNYPAGFNADEAAIGYNAYSLIMTGEDECGTPFPLIFKSFGDFKPGLYFYFVLPFVKILGLTELAVRLPSAFLGIGTVILIYFLGKAVFQSRGAGIFSALLLAISPWHLHFSRGGWETNAATFFITLGALFFIKGLKGNKFIFFSLASFLASMYIYQSPRLVVPVFLIVLFFLYKKNLLKKLKVNLIYLILVGLLAIPLGLQFISGGGETRFSGLSFLSDPGPFLRVNELRGEHQNLDSLDAKFLHNKLTAYGPNFLGHYLDHFRPDFLFINGDSLIRNKVPDVGQFYLVGALFLIVGLISLINTKFTHTRLLVVWILVAPLASAMTYQTPHALRALNMVIPLTLVMGYGLWVICIKLKNGWRLILPVVLIIFLVFEFVHYLESYYIHYPKRYPLSWEYGFKEMVGKLQKYENQYSKVVITDRYDQPYILVLFYKKYDPWKYQPQAILSPRDKFNFGTIRSFDKYEFRSIVPEEVGRASDTLFIGTEKEIPENANVIDKVNFLNGEPAFIFTKT